MNKKIFFFVFVFIFLVSTLSFILAENPLDSFAGQIDDTSKTVEDTAGKVERLTKEDVKWQELGIRWKEILLKNHVISKIDESLKKGNIVFVVLFGRDYSLSLTLLFLIMLWFYFWSQFSKILGTFSTFSSGTSTVISLGMTIILAQIRFFDWASQVFFKLIFYRTGVGGWIWNIGIFLVFILFASLFSRFFTSLKKSVLKFKDESYRKKLVGELEEKNKYFEIISDAFRGMFSKN